MSLLFDLLYVIPAVLYAPVFFLKSRRVGESPALLFRERWGLISAEKRARLQGRSVLWIHAVSVGETMVARRFIDALRAESKEYHFLLTTVTPTGQKLARQSEAADLTAVYVPFDFSFCVESFLAKTKPAALVLIETEIWPNLILRTAKRGLPILMVNARLSAKSLVGYGKVRAVFKPVFEKITGILAQDEGDAARFVQLGIPSARVRTEGNVKFDAAVPEKISGEFSRERLGLTAGDAVWIAGSTHPGEEQQILEVFAKLRAQHSHLRLILAPRHVERVTALVRELPFGTFKFRSWSHFQLGENWDVLIVDQIGILKNIYALGNFVFMGGSWIRHGGQNPIEPAVFNLPVLHGPHVFNFKQVYEAFDHAGAAVCVPDAESCFQIVDSFLKSPSSAAEAGRRGGETVGKYRGASMRQARQTLELIKKG